VNAAPASFFTRSITSTRIRSSARIVLALVTLGGCGAALGQDASGAHPGLTDRWTFQLGAYRPNASTTAHLNSSTRAIGTEISFEDDLGFSDSKTVPALLASVRLGERWKIEGEFLTLHRSSASTVSRTLNWGDRTYTVGTAVSADFDSDIYRLSVGYSFLKNNQAELGVVLGLHVTDFTASLAASTVGGQTGDALAPLPTIGLYGAYAFTPKWLLSGRFDYFSLNYNDYDGSLKNLSLGVDYRFTRHFGAGLAYRYVDYELNSTKSRFTGGVNYRFSGPMLYLVSSF
jgi:hypothetical protein